MSPTSSAISATSPSTPALLADGAHAGRVRKRHNNSRDARVLARHAVHGIGRPQRLGVPDRHAHEGPRRGRGPRGARWRTRTASSTGGTSTRISTRCSTSKAASSARSAAARRCSASTHRRAGWSGAWAAATSPTRSGPRATSGPAPLRIVGDPEGEFCGQHAAEMRPDGHDGRLTLFDNGEECLIDLETGETTRTSDEYARAVEYALDLDSGEAVFLRDHSLHGTKDRAGTRGGHGGGARRRRLAHRLGPRTSASPSSDQAQSGRGHHPGGSAHGCGEAVVQDSRQRGVDVPGQCAAVRGTRLRACAPAAGSRSAAAPTATGRSDLACSTRAPATRVQVLADLWPSRRRLRGRRRPRSASRAGRSRASAPWSRTERPPTPTWSGSIPAGAADVRLSLAREQGPAPPAASAPPTATTLSQAGHHGGGQSGAPGLFPAGRIQRQPRAPRARPRRTADPGAPEPRRSDHPHHVLDATRFQRLGSPTSRRTSRSRRA